MQSMTGYGKAEYSQNGIELSVEIKTVNNRFLDLNAKYPRAFVSFDDAIRKCVQSKIRRGRAELFINYCNVNDSGKKLVVDEDLAGQYADTAKMLSLKLGLENDYTVTALMRSPDVITETVSESGEDVLRQILLDTLSEALDNLNAMRFSEGEKLKNDILSRVNEVERLVGEIEVRAPQLKTEYEQKLKDKISEALQNVNFDESRMLQEVAIFADKSNIDEEITRLKSHITQLLGICESGEDQGKKLDFLMQEFNREANTICSKSNDLTITKYGLALKNEIEKMREQVQNVE